MYLRVAVSLRGERSPLGGCGRRLWIWTLTLGCIASGVWTSAGTATHHEHLYQGSKHLNAPISIYRSPASLRGGHAGTTYIFGRGGGLITYTWPANDRPSTRTDRLAVGFSTAVKDAILVRVDSAPGLGDFLQLHIEQGKVSVVFNVGTNDIAITESSNVVNDGKYHLVRFTRNGGNATLQVDNWAVKEFYPSGNIDNERLAIAKTKVPKKFRGIVFDEWLQEKGRMLTIFNTQAMITIGGKNRSRPFQGQMSGLYYNGLKVLNMAAESHPNVRVNGTVRLVGDVSPVIINQPAATSLPAEMSTTIMATTTTLATTTARKVRGTMKINPVTDDLIVSSAECASDDEDLDECEPSSDKTMLSTSTSEGDFKAHAPKWEYKDTNNRPPGTGGISATEAPRPGLDTSPVLGKLPAGKLNTREQRPAQPGLALFPLPTGHEADSTKVKSPLVTSPMFRHVPTAAQTTEAGVRGTAAAGVAEVVRESSSTTGMVVGIVAAAALCILILLYAMYKYRNRDEGSYQVDETRNYISNSAQTNGNAVKEKSQGGAKVGGIGDNHSGKKHRSKDKEYYV